MAASTKTFSAMVASAALVAGVSAHGYMSAPAVTFLSSAGDQTQFIATIEASATGWSGTFNGAPADNTAAFTTAFEASDYSSLKDVIESLATVTVDGASLTCGSCDPDEDAQPLPDTYVEWSHSDSEGFTSSHEGPCEVWCDDTRVFQDDDCAADYTTAPAQMPYDRDACSGASTLTFYWLALHSSTWQVYINCAPLESSTSTSTSTTTTSSSGTTSATSGTTTASAATDTSTTSTTTDTTSTGTTTADTTTAASTTADTTSTGATTTSAAADTSSTATTGTTTTTTAPSTDSTSTATGGSTTTDWTSTSTNTGSATTSDGTWTGTSGTSTGSTGTTSADWTSTSTTGGDWTSTSTTGTTSSDNLADSATTVSPSDGTTDGGWSSFGMGGGNMGGTSFNFRH